MAIQLEQFSRFVRDNPFGVISTYDAERGPEAALVEVAATDDGRLVVASHGATRKVANLRKDARVAVVIGTAPPHSMQVEGTAELPEGEAAALYADAYRSAFPESPIGSPDYAVIAITPTWVRWIDASQVPPALDEGPLALALG